MGRKNKNSLMSIFRIMNLLYRKNIPIIPGFLMRYIRVVYSCDLPFTCQLGEGVLLKHNGLGVVIHPKAIIGDYTQIYQNVSIAGRNDRGTPVIGKRVFIGAGACILGGITIGDDAIIGANSVVINDIPSKAVVVGIPGKVIRINN
jgi:serine O-acetyltransferase